MRRGTALFFLAAAAITQVAGDPDAVKTQIKVIGNYTTALHGDVNNYNGSIPGLPWALQVQQDAVNLYRQIQIGTSLTNASASFGEPGSLSVSTALLGITGTVKDTLSATASKASDFADLGPLVLASLYQLKASTDEFATALIAKLGPLEQAVAPSVQSGLDDSFNNAITAYGGRTSSS